MVKGDKVICIDPGGNKLTKDKVYTIIDVDVELDGSYITVVRDDGLAGYYFTHRFEPFVEPSTIQRGEKLYTQASKVINGERQTSYGNPEDSFTWIAQRWNQYLKGRFGAEFELTAEDATFMMADFKMARECNQHKPDNIVDATGYLGINFDITEGK